MSSSSKILRISSNFLSSVSKWSQNVFNEMQNNSSFKFYYCMLEILIYLWQSHLFPLSLSVYEVVVVDLYLEVVYEAAKVHWMLKSIIYHQ